MRAMMRALSLLGRTSMVHTQIVQCLCEIAPWDSTGISLQLGRTRLQHDGIAQAPVDAKSDGRYEVG